MYEFWDYPWRNIVGTQAIIIDAAGFIFFANLFYTLSWGTPVLSHYVLKTGELNLIGRWILFAIGTLFSLLVTNLFFVIVFDVLFAD